MLNIYIGKENLPKDKQFILDVEAAFLNVRMTGTEVQREVLKRVERGTYLNDKRFVDRFGGNLYYTDMSTGSKAVMVVEALPECVINVDECGENALELLSMVPEGNVYLSRRGMGLPFIVNCPASLNGKMFERLSKLNEWEW